MALLRLEDRINLAIELNKEKIMHKTQINRNAVGQSFLCPQSDQDDTPLQSSILGGLVAQCNYGGAGQCVYLEDIIQAGSASCPSALVLPNGPRSESESSATPLPSSLMLSSASISSGTRRSTTAADQSSKTTEQPSSVSLDGTLPSERPPAGGQTRVPSASGARKPLVSAGEIAGIVIGILFLVVLVVALLFYIRQQNSRIRALLKPVLYPELAAGHGRVLKVPAEKHLGFGNSRIGFMEMGSTLTVSTQATEIRQRDLRNRIIAVQRELDSLNEGCSYANLGTGSSVQEQADQRNEALQERIRMLESSLQSQWALGLSNEPPPGYLD
ncbi:hypothetical protein FB451DRAFT_1175147 [Mycena latifolia]|nr:hypothetical protein FB451DRAFT_1175147 [Mycena latifolia]